MLELLSGLKDYARAERLARERRMWPLLGVPGLVSLKPTLGIVSGMLGAMDLVSYSERFVS